jgi:short-subunit dehydrogenase
VAKFETGNLNLYEKVVDLNIKFVISMTRLFVDHKKHDCKTWILNVGSLGGYFPLPRKSVYSGSKSFVINFSRALEIELAPLNIQVSVLCPGTVNTNYRIRANNKAASWIGRQSVMEANVVAR